MVALSAQAQRTSGSGPPVGVLLDQSDGIVPPGTSWDSLRSFCISYHVPYGPLAWRPYSPSDKQTPG